MIRGHINKLMSMLVLLGLVLNGCYEIPTEANAKQTLRINPTEASLVVGESTELRVKGLGSGQKAKWKISDSSVIAKTKATKKYIRIKAKKEGSSRVTARVGKKKLSCKVTVKEETTQTYSSNDKFASAVSDMIRDNQVQSSAAIAAADPFYTGRLIAQEKNKSVDYDAYSPKASMRNSDGICILQFESSADAKKAFQQLSNNDDIEWVEPDAYIGTSEIDYEEPSLAISDMQGSSSEHLSWGVSRMGADQYAAKTSRDEIVVAVVDTGVSAHPFLGNRRISGYDYVDNDSDPTDLNSHGTHVAGTIVDCTPGLNVRIMPVRVLDANGNGYFSTIALGIRYAADHGAKVINLSLGGGHSNYTDSAVQYALNKGVTVVAAAGNNYSNTSTFCPAHMSNIIVVGAIDENEDRAYFSNYGNSLDVAAPGVDIVSCVPGGSYQSYQGTSMASPHVAGAAAMIILNHPGSTPSEVEYRIKSCARDLGTAGWDMYYGYGIPDLTALDDSAPVPTATPAPTTKPTATPVRTATPINTTTPVPTTAPISTMVPVPTQAPIATWTPVPTGTPSATAAPIRTPAPTSDPSGEGNDPSGYKYRVADDLTAIITGYTGSGGNLTLPVSLGGYPLSGISDRAFKGNGNITSLRIEGNVWISDEAFYGCSALRKVDIIGIVSGVGSKAFAGCSSLSEFDVTGMMFRSYTDIFSNCSSLRLAVITGIIDNSVLTGLKNAPSLNDIRITGIVS
ncbi:MAG: S8 family serine peptidase [Eubacterium sp.]|nr:S8 family serine peptidase [Eubacterium sp.]